MDWNLAMSASPLAKSPLARFARPRAGWLGRSPEWRGRVGPCQHDGWSCQEVAAALLLNDDTIRGWFKLFEQRGIEVVVGIQPFKAQA
jgi:hypothetical protein